MVCYKDMYLSAEVSVIAGGRTLAYSCMPSWRLWIFEFYLLKRINEKYLPQNVYIFPCYSLATGLYSMESNSDVKFHILVPSS